MTQMKITGGKGVHFTFDNGTTISIQIGGGDYCDNYNFPIGTISEENPLPPSARAEIAIWPQDGDMISFSDGGWDEPVAGYVPINRVLGAINAVRSVAAPATKEALELAISEWRTQ